MRPPQGGTCSLAKNGLVPQKQNLDFLCSLFPKTAYVPLIFRPLFPWKKYPCSPVPQNPWEGLDNSDLFLSIFIAATAIHSLIVKEELRNYCQQMERQNNKRRKYMINRLWYDIFRTIPHINPWPISTLRPSALRLIWEFRVDMGYDTKNVI